MGKEQVDAFMENGGNKEAADELRYQGYGKKRAKELGDCFINRGE